LKKNRWCSEVIALTTLLFGGMAYADGHRVSDHVKITNLWARALPVVSKNGAAYFTAENRGKHDARIRGVLTAIARRAEIHTHVLEDGLARMRQVTEAVVVPAHGTISFTPGGLHIMLMGLEQPLTAGMSFSITLEFEDGGSFPFTVNVLSTEKVTKAHRGTHGHKVRPKHGNDSHATKHSSGG